MFYNLTNQEGVTTISVFFSDGDSRVVARTSPTFEPLRDYLLNTEPHDEEQVRRLVDPAVFIGTEMAEIAGGRVTYDLHNLFFDGKPLHSVIAKHIKAKIEAGDQDWKRLVRFMVNLDENPSFQAQQATYEWVERHGLTITEDGCFLGYKAVLHDHTSSSTGPDNYINGEYYGEPGVHYHVPHNVGDVVSKKRADVDDKPGGGCSVGLHVGTYSYATGFAPVLMTVKVNPRDVVSAGGASSYGEGSYKIRVCRYEVVALNEDKVDFIGKTTSLDITPSTDDGPDEERIYEAGSVDAEAEEMIRALEEAPEKPWKVVEQDGMGYTILEAFSTAKDAEESLEGWIEANPEGEYGILSPEGEYGTLASDFDTDDTDEQTPEVAALVEVQRSNPEPEPEDVDPMVALQPISPDAEFVYASLAEAEAAESDAVLGLLKDTSQGHKPVARRLVLDGAVNTTESSVRRWRKAHGVVLG